MGATYWEAVTPYDEVVERALRRAQIEFFREAGYDLPKRLAERVESMTKAVRSCEQDDPYDLLDFYRDALDQYRQIAANGVPAGPAAQIDLLRSHRRNIGRLGGECPGHDGPLSRRGGGEGPAANIGADRGGVRHGEPVAP